MTHPPSPLRTAVGGGILAATLSGVIAGSIVSRPQEFQHWIKGALRMMLGAFGVRVRLVGMERLSPDRAYLFIANHVSWMDHLILLSQLPQFLIGLEKKENFRIPIYGWAIRRWGQVYIDRENLDAAKDSCRAVGDSLREGTCVMLFPEGTRTLTGELGPFKKGSFHVAIESGVTLVPLALVGLREVWPRGANFVRPGEVRLIFGEPVDCSGLTRDDLDGLMATTRTSILKLLEPE